jgi:hypothetical protein
MSLPLVLRGADDTRSSVEAASEFRVDRRHRFAEPRELDELFGFRGQLERDADLGVRLWLDGERGLR